MRLPTYGRDSVSSMCISSDVVKEWALSTSSRCTSRHVRCQTLLNKAGKSPPTRLIHINTTVDGSLLQIVPTMGIDPQTLVYNALSYCWGGDQAFKLTSARLEEFANGFKAEVLPKTIRDAVQITQWFKINYLWVDAMCIIQDDTADWDREAKTMDQVYQGAFLTIAAQGARNSNDGCFARRSQLMHVPCSLFENDDGTTTFVGVSSETTSQRAAEFEKAPLCTRAWTVQERLLCPRILYFGATLRWECCEELLWEGELTKSVGNMVNEYCRDRLAEFNFKIDVLGRLSDNRRLSLDNTFLRVWRGVAETYSESTLTFPSDRLVALQGIINLLERYTGHENLAGLWRPILLGQLGWHTRDHSQLSSLGLQEPSTKEQYAPSWSWLKMGIGVIWYNENADQDISSPQYPYDVVCEIFSAQASLIVDIEQPGSKCVWIGKICLQGFLSQIESLKIDHYRLREITYDQKRCMDYDFYPDLYFQVEDQDLFFLPFHFQRKASGCLRASGILIRQSGKYPEAYERVGYMSIFTLVGGTVPGSEFGKKTIILV